MKTLVARRLLAVLMLIALTLALSLQLAQPRMDVGVSASPDAVAMMEHCDDCSPTTLAPDCADGLCSGLSALACCGTLAVAVAAPRAERAQIPRFHPGPAAAPEPEPPRRSVTA